MNNEVNVIVSDILPALNNSIKAISSNPILPILESFAFMFGESNRATVTATNLSVRIDTEFEVESSYNFGFCVNAKQLLALISSYSKDETISFVLDDSMLVVTIANGVYKLPTTPFSEFPAEAKLNIGERREFEIGAHQLGLGINICEPTISKDSMLMNCNGLAVFHQNDKVLFVSTDRWKLAEVSFLVGIPDIQDGTNKQFIIPKAALGVIKQNCDSANDVIVLYDDKNTQFQFNNSCVTVIMQAAKFPDYTNVFPASDGNFTTVSKDELLNMAKRVNIFGNQTTNSGLLAFRNESLQMVSSNNEVNTFANELIDATNEGNLVNQSIGINFKHLKELLKPSIGEQFEIYFSGENKPLVIKPAEANNVRFLIMPVVKSTLGVAAAVESVNA